VKEVFDPRALGAESKIDIGIVFLAGGVGGILDAILDVAEFVEPLAFATLCAPAAFGAKKLLEGWFERKPDTPPRDG
jgi:hypothetical protein